MSKSNVNMDLLKCSLAELIGTFIFISVILNVTNSPNPLAPLLIGLALIVVIAFSSTLSQGSMNPAVSLALFMRGGISGPEVAVYIACEIIGALLAVAWFLYLIK